MDHESAIEGLYDLHIGKLVGPRRSELEAHLAECAQCRSFASAFHVFDAVLREESKQIAGHPSIDEIVSLAYEPDALPAHDREAIEAHLKSCRSCRADFSNVCEVEASLAGQGEPPSVRVRDWWRRKPILVSAASVVIALLAYPAYLGLFRLAVERGSVTATETWSGTTPLQFVTGARRGAAPEPGITLQPGHPFVVLGVDLGIPEESEDTDGLRLTVIDHSGTVVTTVETTVGEARQQILATGVITVVLSSSLLSPGPHEIRVTIPERPESGPLLEAEVDVHGPAPSGRIRPE